MPLTFGQNQNVNDSIKYSNDDHAFAALVINDITRAKRLPLALESNDVFNAVRNETMFWYEHKPDATSEEQLTFDISLFSIQQKYLQENKNFELFTNSLVFPSGVLGVYECFYDANRIGGRYGIALQKWQLESILMNSMNTQSRTYGVDNYMASLFASNLLMSMSRHPVVYDYSPLTNIFRVYDLGKRVGSIFCKVALAVPLSGLYNDIWYRKYIMSKVIHARCDQIELYGAQLPGDTQINIGILRDRANELKEEVDRQIEAESDADFYLMKT